MKNSIIAFMLTVTLGLLSVTAVYAQTEELSLSLSRDFGYGGFNNDIQGLFSMKVSGPDILMRVEFFIDDTRIGEDTQAPFRLQFKTDTYPLGQHTLYALGYTSDGQELRSRDIHANFVPASEGGKAAVPLLVIVFVAILLAAIVPILTGRKTKKLPPGSARQYPLGGAICPKCGRPFAMHFYGLNLLTSKLDRCPYCGRWSIIKHASIPDLRAAEQAELTVGQGSIPEQSEEEKLRRELEDSKYQGL